MRSSSEKGPVWPLLLTLVMLLAALGALLWLRGRLLDSRAAELEGTARRFAATGVLGRPESNAIIFENVENLAEASVGKPIRRLHVVKRLRDDREITVLPFHADLTDPGWRDRGRWLRLPVGEEPAGFLYIDVDYTDEWIVNVTIGVIGLLLAAGFAVLITRQRRKEEQVGRLQGELQQRRAELIRLERLALAGQLTANILHDLRKPVLNIKHEVADALEGTPVVDSTSILQSVRRQTDLFMQMLRDLGLEGFVHAESGEPEWCDVAEAIERSLRLVRYEQGGIRVETRVEPGGEYLLRAHPHRLIQLFSNIILNAYQALGDSGGVLVTLSRAGDTLEVLIEDGGPGIPPDKRGTIFSPFVTSKGGQGGSGLGLYICRMIVEELGGSIDAAKSEALGGACFIIRLPAGGR